MRAALALLLLSACSYQEVSKFNSAPTVTLIAPTDGAYVDPDGLVEFIAQVGDAQTASENLVILWQSDVDGTLDETPADANGQVYFATNTLSSGPQKEGALARARRASARARPYATAMPAWKGASLKLWAEGS
jgi:hypothetical protein